ncbi:MAG TPA: calcium-binding protein [Actinomycetota bacterium]|nr:calcium-binding protein [Actinomycetota bacterium]
MKRRLAGVAAAMLLLVVPTLAPVAQAATAKCHGVKATIVGTSRDETIQGTKGRDVIVGRGGNDMIFGKGGNDVVCGGPGFDSVNGQGGSDKIFGDGDNDVLYSGPGNDRVNGGGGSDIVDYFFSKSAVTANLTTGRATGEGTDVLIALEGVGGTAFDDHITGGKNSETFDAGAGNDRVDAGPSVDLIAPGAGNDSIEGGEGIDMLFYLFSETAVNVNIDQGITTSGSETDTFTGIEGSTDSPFNDFIAGDENDNLFISGPGDDHVEAGTGFDFVLYWLADQPMTIDLSSQRATGFGNDGFAGVEGAWGSLVAPNRIVGNFASNALLGGLGDDEFLAGNGDDIMQGFTGNDIYDGGAGNYDDAALAGGTSGVQVDLAAGTATGSGADTLKGIESVEGTEFADVLLGDGANNFLYGLGGNDQLNGGNGNDFIGGGPGNDKTDGGDGSDNCWLAENLVSCEGTAAAPAHPLTAPVESVLSFEEARSF